MVRLLPSFLLSLFFCGVAMAFAFGMGQLRADWLFAALMLAVALGCVTAPVLMPQRG